MSTEAQVVYSLYILCGVISRILSFVLLAFKLGKGNFYFVYLAIGLHIGLMMILQLAFTNCSVEKEDQTGETYCFKLIISLKNMLLKAMSNLYISWSDEKDEGKDMNRQLIVEFIILTENLAISFLGPNDFLTHPQCVELKFRSQFFVDRRGRFFLIFSDFTYFWSASYYGMIL